MKKNKMYKSLNNKKYSNKILNLYLTNTKIHKN
jgi:hypothetical protein